MPYVMNALDRPVNVQVFGSWFEFKPKQIKMIYQPHVAEKMTMDLGDEGLVDFPESLMEPENVNGDEFKKVKAEKAIEGRAKRLRKLEQIRYNEETSLRKDLQIKNLNVDPVAFTNPGLIAALKELVALKEQDKQDNSSLENEARKLMGILDGNIVSTNTGTSSAGNATSAKATKV